MPGEDAEDIKMLNHNKGHEMLIRSGKLYDVYHSDGNFGWK